MAGVGLGTVGYGTEANPTEHDQTKPNQTKHDQTKAHGTKQNDGVPCAVLWVRGTSVRVYCCDRVRSVLSLVVCRWSANGAVTADTYATLYWLPYCLSSYWLSTGCHTPVGHASESGEVAETWRSDKRSYCPCFEKW
eukprot:gene8358-biopygen21142